MIVPALKKPLQKTPSVRLGISSELLRFDADKDNDAEAKFKAALERVDANTLNFKLEREEDIYFDAKARIQGKYQITTQALAQLCSRLMPGLSQALVNLAGMALPDEELMISEEHDPVLALRWLNDTIRLRFKRIKGYSLVIDQEKQVVEGIVGRKYAFLSNLELYNRSKAFIAASKRPAVFSDAVLHGRRVMLRFRDKEALFQIDRKAGVSEPFYGGFHFANSETGDCSIKASAVIVRQWGNTKAISEFADGSKIAHVKGRAFEQRFTDLLSRVRLKSDEITKYRVAIQRLMQLHLGFTKFAEGHNAEILRMLEGRLQRQGLSADLATSIVRHAMHFGSYRADVVEPSKKPEEFYARRTAYDLYNAITYKAKGLPIEEQEKAEQVAFKMLTGKFSFE